MQLAVGLGKLFHLHGTLNTFQQCTSFPVDAAKSPKLFPKISAIRLDYKLQEDKNSPPVHCQYTLL